ncbi:MAG: NnrU family protein [Alphaproteobacteria bacterium]|nr:MAG: NnrU family protein [Alphaproteobacteria bacterium]
MFALIAGLVLFLGMHSVRIFADDWRAGQIAARGEKVWKGVYAAISLAGLVLVVWGFGLAREAPVLVWDPPVWLRHLAFLLNAAAFFLAAQNAGPVGPIKARLGHPMVLAVKIWAIAHLISNGNLAEIILFGSILAWAVVNFSAARRRDRQAGTVRVAGPWRNDLIPGAVGLALWAAFIWDLHERLIGVSLIG